MKRSPIIYFLFFLSGITALVYEIVWTRMLTLVFGHTVYSVSIVLAAFMAGLGCGSFLFGHAIDRLENAWGVPPETGGKAPENEPDSACLAGSEQGPVALLVYGWIEIGVFILAALLSLFLANFSEFYSWIHQWLPESVALQNALKAVFAFSLIFVPTTLMGATLPIISKYYVTDDDRLGTQVGLLYGINTLGAALGCLLTGFLLISVLGVLQTVLLAAGLNLFIGISAIRIYQDSGGERWKLPVSQFSLPSLQWDRGQTLWIGISFLCGFSALAYEVVWTRLLVFSISSTVYSFSMMLAVFLLGIVLGSLLAIPVLQRVNRLRSALIALQAGVGLFVIGTLFGMDVLLSPPWNSYRLTDRAATLLQYFRDSSSLMLVPTIFLGMSFPILIKLVAGGPAHVGRGTGQIYASNTLGAICGSLAMGFFILPLLGSQKSLMGVAGVNLLLALGLFLTGPYLSRPARRGLSAAGAGVLAFLFLAMPGNLLDGFFMRDSAGKRNLDKLMFFEEGLTDTVAVFKDNYGLLDPDAKRLITNGISMSASNVIASRYMKLFAHVPILLTESPKDVLVVCFGTGQTTGAAGIHPGVERVDSLELSGSVIRAGEVFAEENHDVLNNPKVHIVLQDGRNHLLTTRQMYDVITSEPPPPRTAFTVNLYTQEYYELTKKRLKPGGIVAQWIPLHSQGETEVAMHFKTFLSVFPHAIAWMSVANEILIIGSESPIVLDVEKLKQRMAVPVVREAMQAIQISGPHSLLGNIWLLEKEMRALSEGYDVITDNRPAIEFYLDLGEAIGIDGRERYVFNRVPFKELTDRILHLSEEDRSRLRQHYRMMDLYQRGVMYGNRGQLLRARSLAAEDGLVRYHLQAGEAQMQRLLEEVREDPDNLETLLNLAHTHYQIGEYENSLEVLDRVLKKNPKNGFAHLYRGLNLMELGKRSEAKGHFDSAAKYDPRQVRTVMREIGLIELHNQLEKNPESQGLLVSTAQYYNMKQEYLKALDFSLKALEMDPLDVKTLQSIVYSYRGLGEAGEVLDYATRYRMVDKEDIHLDFILGEIHAKTMNCEQAIPHLERVLEKNDSYQNARKLLRDCQRETADPRA